MRQGVLRGPRITAAWALGTLVADQAAKWAVGRWLRPGESVALVGEVVRLTHVTNRGAAFGLLEGRYGLFAAATLAMLVLAGVLAARIGTRSSRTLMGLGLAAGGASGNLVDRLRDGAVLDFIDVAAWPVFNLADTAIVAGVVLLLWHLAREAPPTVAPHADGGES
ncbi:MAG TPA: signal peptidase II [Limnochordales bacterium]